MSLASYALTWTDRSRGARPSSDTAGSSKGPRMTSHSSTAARAQALGQLAFLAMPALSPIGAAIVSGTAYAVIRLALRVRPDGFVRHWTWWTARRVLGDGRLSGHARCPTPRFPYAPCIERDVPP